MAKNLTYAQAETLAELFSCSVIADEIPFRPLDIFPERNNDHNGKRRCITALATKGLLKPDPYQPGYYRPVVNECVEAWDTWKQKNPDVEFWF